MLLLGLHFVLLHSRVTVWSQPLYVLQVAQNAPVHHSPLVGVPGCSKVPLVNRRKWLVSVCLVLSGSFFGMRSTCPGNTANRTASWCAVSLLRIQNWRTLQLSSVFETPLKCTRSSSQLTIVRFGHHLRLKPKQSLQTPTSCLWSIFTLYVFSDCYITVTTAGVREHTQDLSGCHQWQNRPPNSITTHKCLKNTQAFPV